MLIHEYEIPAGTLNLNSTNDPDRGHHGDSLLLGKYPHGTAWNRTQHLVISNQKRLPLDHVAGLGLVNDRWK
jgi:hypothetical protein